MNKAIDAARRAANRASTTRKYVPVDFVLRAAGDDAPPTVQGHAALFNTLSQPLFDLWEGRFVEQIAPGAFTKTLRECDCKFLLNHNSDLLLGRYVAGRDGNTLQLAEDERGLAIEARAGNSDPWRNFLDWLHRGDISQMSFAFQVVKDDWDETNEGTPRRTVQEVRLHDVSAVADPAYEETEIGLRSREARALLHAFGLTDIPEAQRGDLLRALTSDATLDDALLPALRAAQNALAELVARAEPATSHSDGYALDLLTRRHALNARKHALGVA